MHQAHSPGLLKWKGTQRNSTTVKKQGMFFNMFTQYLEVLAKVKKQLENATRYT